MSRRTRDPAPWFTWKSIILGFVLGAFLSGFAPTLLGAVAPSVLDVVRSVRVFEKSSQTATSRPEAHDVVNNDEPRD